MPINRFAILLLLLSLVLAACGKIRLEHPESVVRYGDVLLVSNAGNGDIVRVDRDGNQEVICHESGSTRGLCLQGGILYAASDIGVLAIDPETGKLQRTFGIESQVFLNDVSGDGENLLWVSDTQSGWIYRIDLTRNVMEEFIEFKMPNGVWFDSVENALFCVSYGGEKSVCKIPLDTLAPIPVSEAKFNQADGLVRDTAGNWYVSSWETGCVYRISGWDSEPEVIADGIDGPADIYFDIETNRIVIPAFNINELIEVDIKE